jgi:hypothetical protein
MVRLCILRRKTAEVPSGLHLKSEGKESRMVFKFLTWLSRTVKLPIIEMEKL